MDPSLAVEADARVHEASFEKTYYYWLLLGGGIENLQDPSAASCSSSSGKGSKTKRADCGREAYHVARANASAVDETAEHRYAKSTTLVLAAAADLGIEIDLYGWTGWTRDSQKLVALAGMVEAARRVEKEEQRQRRTREIERNGDSHHQHHYHPITSSTGSQGGRSRAGSGSEHGSEHGSSRHHHDHSDGRLPSPPDSLAAPDDDTSNTATDHIVNPLQHMVVETLFASHFSGGADLSSRPFLLGVARLYNLLAAFETGGGMERRGRGGTAAQERMFVEWLGCAETAAMVDSMEATGRDAGVEGVPTFEIQGRYRIGGAQMEDVFLDVFERVRAEA